MLFVIELQHKKALLHTQDKRIIENWSADN